MSGMGHVVYVHNAGACFSEITYDQEFQHFLRGQESVVQDVPTVKVPGLTPQQLQALMRLAKLPAFKNLPNKIQNDAVCTLLL